MSRNSVLDRELARLEQQRLRNDEAYRRTTVKQARFLRAAMFVTAFSLLVLVVAMLQSPPA